MDPDDVGDLRELLVLVESGSEVEPEPSQAFRMIGIGPGALLFRGEALELHERLTYRLSRSALADGGLSITGVGAIIDEFVGLAATSGEREALAWIKGEFSQNSTDWTLVQSAPFRMTVDRFEMGACAFASDLDAVQPGLRALMAVPAASMRAPFVFTTVQAADRHSARVLAIERFAEAESVVALLSGYADLPEVPHIVIGPETMMHASGSHVDPLITGVDGDGVLLSGFQELSDSLKQSEVSRNDWTQRVVSACRWFRVAATTRWPSQSIAASFSALECLFIRKGEPENKRDRIANRLTELARLEEMTPRNQIRWLGALYGYRSDAVHAGKFHRNERDAQRLEALTRVAIGWGIRHLDHDHGGASGGSCTSIEEALGDHPAP